MPPQTNQANPQDPQAPTAEEWGEAQKKIQDMLQRIEQLEGWKTERMNQQLTYPLDFTSQQIIAGL